jgi:histidine ammonia-lyase
MASQALHVTQRAPPPPLEEFLAFVRGHVAPVEEDRMLGPELAQLSDAIAARVFSSAAPLDSRDT